MDFQILQVILWPNSPQFTPHKHEFKQGAVNIITGSSKTGKSALIPVVDYCLGSSKCAIPVGAIRQKCSWFGLLVQSGPLQMLLARKNPGRQDQSGEMIFRLGEEVTVPNFIGEDTDGRTSSDIVKKELNKFASITNLELDAENSQRYAQAPGFRDLLAFNFQPQNIVANPNILFFRADMPRYRERLRVIFPYALGALTDLDVHGRWELQVLEPQLRRLERQLGDQQAVSDRWKAEIFANVHKARALGLLPADTVPLDAEGGVHLLRRAVKSSGDVLPSQKALEDTSLELARQERREKAITRELGVLRRRKDELTRLQQNLPDFQGALTAQRDRLQISKWLRAHSYDEPNCPLCGNKMDEQHKELNALVSRLADIDAQIEDISPQPEAFGKELRNVNTEMSQLLEKLHEARSIRNSLALASDEGAKLQYQAGQAAEFIGELRKSLEIFDSAVIDSDLVSRRNELLKQVANLRNRFSDSAVRERLVSILGKIDDYATSILPDLNAEHTDWPIKLDLSELSLRIIGKNGDEYALWQIGSGANWLAYHIVTTISLQLFFISDGKSPVPSFLIYDQPSQVYFPRAALMKDEGRDDFSINQEDFAAVRSIFSSLTEAVTEARGGLQIIVLDHARSEIWDGLEPIHVVGEWRGGNKLVPDEWPDRPESNPAI